MSGNDRWATRPGWIRDVELPRALTELTGRLSGEIGLPVRLFWSGPQPQAVRWDLASPQRRRDLYEIVLTEGSLDDARELVNGQALVEQWNDLYLPPWIRAAWQPLVDLARSAA